MPDYPHDDQCKYDILYDPYKIVRISNISDVKIM